MPLFLGSELYGWCEQTLSEEQNRTLGRWNFDISKEVPVQHVHAACEYLPPSSGQSETDCPNCPLTGSYTSSRTIVNRAHSASSTHSLGDMSLGDSSSNSYSSANSPWTLPESQETCDSFDYINDITAHSWPVSNKNILFFTIRSVSVTGQFREKRSNRTICWSALVGHV